MFAIPGKPESITTTRRMEGAAVSNQMQAISALKCAKDLVVEASSALRTSRDVQWVSLSAGTYQEEVVGLTKELDDLDLELNQLEALCGHLFGLLPTQCWAPAP